MALKRIFDIVAAVFGLLAFMPAGILIGIVIIVCCGFPVFYRQQRIGRFGKPFQCVKFRTMSLRNEISGTVTAANDTRITPVGRFLRRYKLDEFPQLWNVLTGRMSFVGPRPDVPGYADRLVGEDRIVLSVRPGITGPASIFFRHEEMILASVKDPENYNDSVIWPLKVKINRRYVEKLTLWNDLRLIAATIMPCIGVCPQCISDSPRNVEELESCVKNWVENSSVPFGE